MSKYAVNWLLEELPSLVEQGIVPANVSEAIRLHYQNSETKAGRQWLLVLFGILGAVLISSGTILLLAHNWQTFGRPMRIALSLAPLVIGQILSVFSLLTHRNSTAWREGAGTFWALSIGAGLALISQTYHLSGDLAGFLLTWALVGLPVVYLLSSSCAAMLYWVGISAWVCNLHWWEYRSNLVCLYWPLMMLAVPHLLSEARNGRYQPRVQWMLWTFSISGIFGIASSAPYRMESLLMLAFCSYFSVLYQIGSFWLSEGNKIWQRPLQTVGAVGAIIVALLMTYRDCWEEISWPEDGIGFEYWLRFSLITVWIILAALLWVVAWKRREPVAIFFGALPLLALLGCGLLYFNANHFLLVLMNVYLLALGVTLISVGVRSQRISVVNFGMLIICALIVAKFFDEELSFLARGLAFIGIGIGFLVANLWFVQKQRGVV